jgi:hypothetical protein
MWPAGSPFEVPIQTFPDLEDATLLPPEPPGLGRASTGSGFWRGGGGVTVESAGETNGLNWPQ